MKKVSLTGLSREDIHMLLNSLRIAFEDGSIYGGTEEDTPEQNAINARGDDLEGKLHVALGKMLRSAPPAKADE